MARAMYEGDVDAMALLVELGVQPSGALSNALGDSFVMTPRVLEFLLQAGVSTKLLLSGRFRAEAACPWAPSEKCDIAMLMVMAHRHPACQQLAGRCGVYVAATPCDYEWQEVAWDREELAVARAPRTAAGGFIPIEAKELGNELMKLFSSQPVSEYEEMEQLEGRTLAACAAAALCISRWHAPHIAQVPSTPAVFPPLVRHGRWLARRSLILNREANGRSTTTAPQHSTQHHK